MTTTPLPLAEATRQILRATHALFTNEVMSHSGHANLSARLDDQHMALTNKGQVRELTSDDIAVVNFDGKTTEGKLDPTNAEIIAMHSEIYKLRPAVGGIVHTHSPALLTFALANQELPCRYEALLRWGQATTVPVADWAPRGTPASVSNIVDLASKNPATNAVLLGNHGVLVFGDTPEAAVSLLTVLEEAAQGELDASALGGASDLPSGALEAVQTAMARVR